MAIRSILYYPQSRAALRTRSEPVAGVNRQVKSLVRDLVDTLLANPGGIDLAAPQIGVHQRVVIVRLGSDPHTARQPASPVALINPVILAASDERRDMDGCLSFPGWFGYTVRPHTLRVQGLKADGQPFTHTFSEYDAVLVHHEIDHLEGVLFIDHIRSPEDLFRFHADAQGKRVKVPLSAL